MSIKEAFVTRYHEGYLVELDYKQLEIRVLALASGCKQLIRDINEGIDLHTVFAAKIFGKPETTVSPAERKMAKGFSFQLQYGASAKSIAKFWGVKEALTEQFIKEYFARYPEIKKWQEENRYLTKKEGKWAGDFYQDSAGLHKSVQRSIIPSIWDETGLFGGFHITEEMYGFPATKIKNYPIQGGAADVLDLVMNAMVNEFLKKDLFDKACLIGQIHDSLLFDLNIKKMEMLPFTKIIKEIAESVPALLEVYYNVKSPVSFPVDIKIGKNWDNMMLYTFPNE